MLFNLYIDDIDEIFDESCQPVDIQNESLNHFLYAGDLVIVSQSREGLQNSLERVHKFAVSKNLKINISKSKCMVYGIY